MSSNVVNSNPGHAQDGGEGDLMLPGALSSAPNPISLIKALRSRWRLPACVGFVAAIVVAGACLYFLPPPKQMARTLMRVPPGSPFLFRTAEQVPNIQDHQRNQMAMVKSRLVLKEALKNSKAASLATLSEVDEPIQWLERELQADFTVAPEVLRITLTGDNAEELVVLVNAVRDAYKTEILDRERAERGERLRAVGDLRTKKENEMRNRREEQRKLEQLAGGRDAGSRGLMQAFQQQHLNHVERELIQTQSDLRRAQADLAAWTASEKLSPPTILSPALVDEQLAKEPTIQSARARIQQLRVAYEETVKAAIGEENSPKAKEIKKRISDEEQTLAVLRQKLVPGAEEDLRQRARYETARNKIHAETRIPFLKEDEKALTAEVERLRNLLKEKGENVAKADAQREDMTHHELMMKRIVEEEEALNVELGFPARYNMLEEGVIVKSTDSKRALIVAAGAGLGTLAAVLLGFALLEFRLRRVYTPDDVVFGLGLPLVGSIPDSETKQARARQADGSHKDVNEAIDTVRTMLLRRIQEDGWRVVMITSARGGEGKTSVSTQLATSLAQVGFNTLLIDGDLRNPVAHRVFQLPRGPGLCEVLRDEKSLDDVIQNTPFDHLSMISAGCWDGGSTRALAQERARQIVANLRERFDVIIIDSSPVLPVVDPLLLGQYADVAILSVLREVSCLPSIYAAYQRLTDGGIRVLGAVMSGVRIDRYGVQYPSSTYSAEQSQQQEPEEAIASST